MLYTEGQLFAHDLSVEFFIDGTLRVMSDVLLSREPISVVCKQLGTDPVAGLSEVEVASRVRVFGLNQIETAAVSSVRILLRQFASPFIYLLLGAALIAFLLGEFIDSTVIGLFLLINAGLGFIQEYRSEKTASFLEQFAVRNARVVRGGREIVLPATKLVPGDIVFLETGSIVPADIRLVYEHGLLIDESILTGESIPVSKSVSHTGVEAGLPSTVVFSGTAVLAGSARGVVISTGLRTMVGNIAVLSRETKRRSGFEAHIGSFSSFILKLVIVTIVCVFVANLFIKGEGVSKGELLLFSIALAVSVIPEALPVVTTFSLSRGARALARQKVIVKRLSAIEDMGGIEVLCTDKTGTITENHLAISGYAPHTKKEFLECAYAGRALHSDSLHREPFDVAIEEALSSELKASAHEWQRYGDESFDPETRLNAAYVAKKGEKTGLIIIRGAPEAVLAHTRMSQEERRVLHEWMREVGSKGQRTFAVAKRRTAFEELEVTGNSSLIKGMFVFVGAAAFHDPIKPTTKSAIAAAKELGVSVKMITGDAPEVAESVARDIGLVTGTIHVITGDVFNRMSHQEKHDALRTQAVFARITPKQKHEMVSLLRERVSVGFLGEGINDAPALKAADVSLVVSSAADIAREAADIILLQRSLLVVIEGIRGGRTVFSNTMKYIHATLASNFGNFYAVAAVSLFVTFLPMLPIQLLLLNLLSDVPLISIAADRVSRRDLAQPSYYDSKHIVLLAMLFGIISTVFDFIFFSVFVTSGPAILQTNWFIGSLLTELIFVLSIRSFLPFWRAGMPAKSLGLLIVGAAGVGIVLPFIPFAQRVFHFVPPTQTHLLIIGCITLCYFVATESLKWLLVQRGWGRLSKRF